MEAWHRRESPVGSVLLILSSFFRFLWYLIPFSLATITQDPLLALPELCKFTNGGEASRALSSALLLTSTFTVSFSSDLLWSHPAERHLYADSLTSTLPVLSSTLCIHHAPGHCHLDAEYVSQGGPYKGMIRSSFPISHLSFKSGLFLIMTSPSEMKKRTIWKLFDCPVPLVYFVHPISVSYRFFCAYGAVCYCTWVLHRFWRSWTNFLRLL